jgi:hypothetical protein
MLRPNLFGTFDDFGKKYCLPPASPAAAGSSSGGGGRGFKPKYSGTNPATAAELHRLLMANVMVRRTKGQSGVSLPDKTRLKVRTLSAAVYALERASELCTQKVLAVLAHLCTQKADLLFPLSLYVPLCS